MAAEDVAQHSMTPKRKPKRPSLRQAVNDFCKACLYDKQEEGSWRKQARNCTATACPLYPVRPRNYSRRKKKS